MTDGSQQDDMAQYASNWKTKKIGEKRDEGNDESKIPNETI